MSDITLGIIGSGQLGSLLCKAAKKLNIKTVVISDDEKDQHKITRITSYLLNMMTKKR